MAGEVLWRDTGIAPKIFIDRKNLMPDSLLDVIHEIVTEGSKPAKVVAEEIGKPYKTLMRELDEDFVAYRDSLYGIPNNRTGRQ